jgi:hypothetical protein
MSKDQEISIDSNAEREDTLSIEYGDIIEIIAPTNPSLHENTFFVNYIDETKIKIINLASKEFIQLNLNAEQGGFSDESILQVNLLDRCKESGYARQKGLLPRVWVDVYFKGLPTITGEITDLEEDQIEITTYPDLQMLYIDFFYRGIPENIPIEKFVIREKPRELDRISSLKKLREKVANSDEDAFLQEAADDDATQDFLPSGESVIHIPETAEPDLNVGDVIREETARKRGIVYEEYLEKVSQFVEVRENERRYTIELQTTSLMDELLSTIPYFQRTTTVLNHIHILIERYRELRELYSSFDDNGNIRYLKTHDTMHKPLATQLLQMNVNLPWIVPIVSLKKKLYTNSSEEVEMPDVLNVNMNNTLLEEEEMKGLEYYNNRDLMEQPKYSTMYRRLNSYMTPFESPDVKSSYLKTAHVKTRIESIVETLPDFKSPAFFGNSDDENNTRIQNTVDRGSFIRQVFSNSITRPIWNAQHHYMQHQEMMRADEMTVSSIAMMPESMIHYTRLFQQRSSLLHRVNLHENLVFPFLFLNKKTYFERVPVEDYSREISYEDAASAQKPNNTKLKYFAPYQVTRFDPLSEMRILNKYLYSVLPNTEIVLKWAQQTSPQYSVYETIRLLEPFMIYEQDLVYKHYNNIRFFIKQQIPLLTKVLAENNAKFKQYRDEVYSSELVAPLLMRLLTEKKELLTQFLSVYRIQTNAQSSHEILDHVRLIDGGNVFAKILMSLLSVLVTPNPLIPLENIDIDIPTDEYNERADACNNRTLAKRYDSLADLERDNGKADVFFEKDLDDTPYELLKKYEKEQAEMSEDKFLPYFAENLVQKHGIAREMAETFALQIIAGRRVISDGQYAMLEITPKLRKEFDESSLNAKEKGEIESETEIRKQTSYYIRKNMQWIKDEAIEDIMFMDDKQLFCNWNDLHRRSAKKEKREPSENSERRKQIQEIERQRIRKEFDRRYDVNRDVFETKLKDDLLRSVFRVFSIQRVRQIQQTYANDFAYELGKRRAIAEPADSAILISPHLELKHKILDDPDFVEKQKNIVRFVDRFCREPMESLSESPYWKYCKDTNTKLMPAFQYTLAREFCIFGQQAYLTALHKIVASQGYQEGNAIYDKHSDEWIRNIDNVAEEGYTEEGFRIITNAVMEEDLETTVLQKFKKNASNLQDTPLFENESQREIHQIFAKFTSQMAKFNVDVIQDIRRISFSICEKVIESKSLYEKEAEKQKAKGKKTMAYEDMRNREMLFIVIAVTFTFMQTSIPSFRPSRTVPSCVFSLDGFPLTGEEDIQGIKYMACILKRLATDNAPWNTVYQKKESFIVQYLIETLKTVAKWPNIQYLYEKKREYLDKNPHEYEVIPDKYKTDKWTRFLPPIVRTDANKHLSPVSASFIQEFWGMAKKGQLGQTAVLATIQSKIANYGYSIIEFIQHVVRSKELLMKTASNVPFVQNACCNETRDYRPLVYFIRQENGEVLANYIKILVKLSGEVYRIQLVSYPRTFVYPMTYRSRMNIDFRNLIRDEETLIYAAMIHYCKLDRGDVPPEYRRFFSEIPVGYNASGSLESKIAFLQQFRKFSESDLLQLMTIVRRKNMVETETQKEEISNIARIRDILNSNQLHFDPIFIRHLQTLLDTKEDDEQIAQRRNEFVDYLYENNTQLFSKITQFMHDYGNLKESKMEDLAIFLARLDIWSLDEEMSRVLQFMKNMVFDLTHYFPGILLNHTISSETLNFYPTEKSDHNRRIHRYWQLSDADTRALSNTIDQYYGELYALAENIGIDMNDFFANLREPLITIYSFVEEMPGLMQTINKDVMFMLSTYVVYHTIGIYIDAVNPILRRGERIESKEDEDVEFSVDEEVFIESMGVDEIQTMNENLAKIIQVFLNMHRNNKKYLDYSYSKVEQEMAKNNEAEKERVMSRLENMEKPERRVENLAKKYKLGVWSVGQQKGIFVYDKKTSDREREENLLQGIMDADYEDLGEPVQMMRDADEMAADDEVRWDEEQDDEMNAFPRMEGYLDGGFYEEDGDGEDTDFPDQDFQ